MLKKITIKNIAIIDEIEVTFNDGLNIITGETGAGKSIIVGAMGLLLGEKARNDMIRQGCDKAVVEGVFLIPESLMTLSLWDDIDFNDSELILRRELYREGRNRIFANDSPVNISTLQKVGDALVDLHGQHEHQALFKTDYHLTCLDNFGIEPSTLKDFQQTYKAYRRVKKERDELVQNQRILQEKQDFIAFQLEEIEKVNPQKDEDAQLEHDEKILKNSERILQSANSLNQLLYEDEDSVYGKLNKATEFLNILSDIDPQFQTWQNTCNNALISAEEIAKGCQTYVSKIDFDPARLEDIRERLNSLARLKKKYGPELDDVLSFYSQTKDAFTRFESIQEDIDTLTSKLQDTVQTLEKKSIDLSNERKKVAVHLQDAIMAVLSELGMPDNRFHIQISTKHVLESPICIDGDCVQITSGGMDKVEFMISLNKGEPLQALKEVASGGEISRIMLALKNILTDADAIPVLIFDEIDSGISGRIARVVGQRLKVLAQKHQILCITHLPQIASIGDTHLRVEKVVQGDRTVTRMQALDDSARVEEIAKLLGGETVTETALQSARELIQVDI